MADSLPNEPGEGQTLQPKLKKKGFGVAASPFNAIKLELGVCAILGVLLWLGADSITADDAIQLLLLLIYGLLAAGWLILRTRSVLRHHTGGPLNAKEGA